MTTDISREPTAPVSTVRSIRFPTDTLAALKAVGHPRGVNGIVIEAVTYWLATHADGDPADQAQRALDTLARLLATTTTEGHTLTEPGGPDHPAPRDTEGDEIE
jgi:hypothetical protein